MGAAAQTGVVGADGKLHGVQFVHVHRKYSGTPSTFSLGKPHVQGPIRARTRACHARFGSSFFLVTPGVKPATRVFEGVHLHSSGSAPSLGTGRVSMWYLPHLGEHLAPGGMYPTGAYMGHPGI